MMKIIFLFNNNKIRNEINIILVVVISNYSSTVQLVEHIILTDLHHPVPLIRSNCVFRYLLYRLKQNYNCKSSDRLAPYKAIATISWVLVYDIGDTDMAFVQFYSKPSILSPSSQLLMQVEDGSHQSQLGEIPQHQAP